MKQLIIIFCFLLYGAVQTHAQVKELKDSARFSLFIELKKPNGKIDEDAYILLTIQNRTGEKIGLLHGGNGMIGPQLHSFFFVQELQKNGDIETSYSGTCIYLQRGKSYHIPDDGKYSEKVPIKFYVSGMYGTGFFSSEQLKSMNSKIRAVIKDFKAGGLESQTLYTVNLYSNWLDVSHEDFSAIEDKIGYKYGCLFFTVVLAKFGCGRTLFPCERNRRTIVAMWAVGPIDGCGWLGGGFMGCVAICGMAAFR